MWNYNRIESKEFSILCGDKMNKLQGRKRVRKP